MEKADRKIGRKGCGATEEGGKGCGRRRKVGRGADEGGGKGYWEKREEGRGEYGV